MRFAEFKLTEAVVNDALKKIQQYLISKGYDLGPKKDDGIWGPYTKAAIKAFKDGVPPAQVAKPTPTPAPTPAPTTPNAPSQQTAPTANTTADTLPNGDIMPTKGRLSGQYGKTVPGPQGKPVKHPGVDIAAPEGTPIVAPANGKITLVRPNSPSAGNYIEMVTDAGERHRFMHMSKFETSLGAVVKKGDIIGRVGSTGFSTGNHLHWEKYAGGTQVNPLAE
jgi:murein DD-endopeptidase MepM/ murein hydrolase activator NlpD